MQELRYILVALGGIAIAALLIHGLWSNRKNRQPPIRQIKEKSQGRTEPKSRERDGGSFDGDGIGQVRVVSGGRRDEPRLRSDETRQPELNHSATLSAFDDDDDDAELPPVVRKPAPRPAQPAPVYEDEEDEEEAYEDPIAEPVEEAPVAPARKPAQVIRRTPVHRSRPREPLLQPLDDAPLDNSQLVEPSYAQAPTFGARDPVPEPQAPIPVYDEPAYEEAPVAPVREPVQKIWQDVYVINLMARPGQDLQGATLLSSLLAQGFKFGEMDIFHCHEEPGGKGEVLFSMINMVKPGTFNPYRMEQFSTPGVSLFMQLPLRSNAAFAFEHMLHVADQLASDLDAMLTDAARSPLSAEAIARYRHELAAYEASRD